MAMTKTQIISALAEEMGVSKKVAAAGLEKLVCLAYKEAKNGLRCRVWASWWSSTEGAHGRNPKTGEAIQIPAKRVVSSASPRPPRSGAVSDETLRRLKEKRRIRKGAPLLFYAAPGASGLRANEDERMICE